MATGTCRRGCSLYGNQKSTERVPVVVSFYSIQVSSLLDGAPIHDGSNPLSKFSHDIPTDVLTIKITHTGNLKEK
jgi:hypothetical protein